MNARASTRPLAMRRQEVQRRVAAQRAEIAVAWTDFEYREARLELKLRRGIAWTRRASGLAVAGAVLWTLRRLVRNASAAAPMQWLGKAVGAMATWRSLRRLVNSARAAFGRSF